MNAIATYARPSALDQCSAARNMREKGFHVFRDVLSPNEIARLREATRLHFKAAGRPDPLGGFRQANIAVEIPALNWLFYHPRLHWCLRQAIGSDEVMFTSDATAYKDVLVGWHKDDRGYFIEPTYGVDECVVYKVGIYLYDHDSDGAGLWVREGSHRSADDAGIARDTAMKAGSIVVFDVRATHKGMSKTLSQRALLRALSWLPSGLQRHATSLFKTVRMLYRTVIGRERIALVLSYGLPNSYTREFAKRSMRRQVSDTPGTSPFLPPQLRDKIESTGILLAEDEFVNL